MSSSVAKPTPNKASNSSAPPASAWSKGPPQSSATSRAQSPANAPNTPTTQSRRQSTLGSNGPPAVKQAPRGVAAGTGHRPTGSINFGSIEATQAPEKKAETATPPATTPLPATTPATAPKLAPAAAQPPTNGIKVVAPTPTAASTAPATTTAPTTASTAPAAAATPPGTTPTPSKQKKVNVHALFQGGGMPSVTTTPPTNTPSTPAQPPAPTPAAPRGPGSGFNDRNNPVPFPRSPQIGRPTLPGPASSGGHRPAGSPRMSANMPLQHQHQHQHPMAHPHQHHTGQPGHPLQPPPQWGGGYYYPPPHDYNPYAMYWGGPPQHQHPHMAAMHQPPMQPSPRTQPAQPRPPSTPPVPNNASPHPLPPITTSALQAPPSAPSPSLSVNAPTFVPGGLRRPTNPVRISTPNGDALTFEGQIPSSPKVATPIQTKRASVPIRMETAQQKEERLAKEREEKEKERKEKEEKERKEREKAEEEKRAKEEAERKEKEEAERKIKEEEERKAKEEADRKAEEERKAREEAERKAEEERIAKEKEEAERKAKEEEERKAREEAERLEAERRVEEERKAEEERKLKEEAERKIKEEEERKAKEEAEAAALAEAEAKAKEEAEAKAAEAKAKEEAEAKEAAADEARDTVAAPLTASPKPANGLLPSTAPGRPSPLSISTTGNERSKRPVPGPLDLSSAQANRVAAPPSALASARIIEDLNAVSYPETIKTPNPDLNIAATPGKFRYDRDFLLQFMGVCKEKPDSLPPLDAIGLEPGDSSNYSVGSRSGGRRLNSLGMGGGAPALQRQGSVGLGLGPGLANRGGFAMGNFQSPSNSQSRFDASNAARAGGMQFAGGPAGRLTPMGRSASQGGVGGANPREAKRTRSQRGRDRGDNVRGSGFQTPANQGNLEPVVPLERKENAWVADSTQRNPKQVEERQLVERKVKALLNKLTMDKFDSISDQIIEWANKSEQEKDGSTLMQVIKLVFEKAKDEAAFSEMYARLCRKMMERVSPNIQDETIRNSEGQPITGGMLFRKYLLNRCQEDFERGWSAKEAALAAAAAKAGEDKAAEVASEGNGEAVLYSEEYYAAAKAKRQGLGLVRFIGELFKLQMLTERIMHECIKKLLSNVVNPEEEEIESLCKLLTTVGQSLDNPKARNHMDIYFERMQDMAKSSNINSRMQFMLLDVIEFRSRNWQSRAALPRPPPAHQDSSRDDSGRHGVSRGGSRRGEARGATESDGWNVASGTSANRPAARAGDLSQFGKISKPTGIQFGPSSVFSKKDANKRDSGSIGRSSGANMFSALSSGAADGPPPMERTPSSRKASVDLGPGGSPASGPGERRKLNLLPRTRPADADADKEEDKEEDKDEDKDEGKEEAELAAMTEEEAQNKVKEDVKEYLGVENIDEAIMALEALPSEHRHLFVDKLVNASMDGGNKVVVLAEKLFSAARSRSVISPDGFERGLLPTIEMADDLSIDVPKTYEWLARMIHAAGLDKAKTEEMAGKISVYGEPRVPPRELLIKEFEKVSSA